MEPDADVDAMVADAVRSVRDRFGADGLRDLVALASAEIASSERAVADLGEIDRPVLQAGSGPIPGPGSPTPPRRPTRTPTASRFSPCGGSPGTRGPTVPRRGS
jgi:hypothetical protein